MNNNNKTHRHTASNPESPAPIVDTHHSPPPDIAINYAAHSLAAPARITNIGSSIAGPPALKTPRPITATRLTSARAPKSPSALSAAGDIGAGLRWAPPPVDDGLARLPIRVTLITPLLINSQWPVLVAASLTGVSIDVPIQIPIQQHSTTPMLTGDVLPDQLQPGLLTVRVLVKPCGNLVKPVGLDDDGLTG
ncbi:hypothetical protein N7523_007372 [Penicillium sp. IBT 18751x]|nr:hypothetical protein N7523_008405 [Penicillium sp. IBT 18751x]KAJ6111311.1 hypothetical protein N7523_007372 [Penicillium sp. IBT 18751x]